jgi:SAM-dependent methyltransferase
MDDVALRTGDPHYRAYVGPPAQYDFMGITQVALLCGAGLREHHKLLDIGCGSLRAARMLIPFLSRGHYFGIEPNKWLVREGIAKNIGGQLALMKRPKFSYSSQFDCDAFGEKFDFIIAQSILSHTEVGLARKCIGNVSRAIAPDGLFLATFVLPRPKSNTIDPPGEAWIYPGLVAISEPTIYELFCSVGLHSWKLPWFHPRQVWYAASLSATRLSAEDVEGLTGYVVGSDKLRRRGPGRRKRRGSRYSGIEASARSC